MESSSDSESDMLNDVIRNIESSSIESEPGKMAMQIRHHPARVCKDYPFRAYYNLQIESPGKYLNFLKELEKSTSRHDLLFWVFDILCSGRELGNGYSINGEVLDQLGKMNFPDLSTFIRYCGGTKFDTFSQFMKKLYPYLIDFEMDELFTYESDNADLVKYRTDEFLLISNKGKLCNIKPQNLFSIDPMNGLTDADFPENISEPIFEDDFDPDEGDFLLALMYQSGILNYNGPLKFSTECILVDKNDYKRMQVKAKMKKIISRLLRPFSGEKFNEIRRNKEILIVKEAKQYKRALLLGPATSSDHELNICVFFIDEGICRDCPKMKTFTYLTKEEFPPLSVIVPRNKLPEDLKLGDGFVTDENGEYVRCVRASEQSMEDFLHVGLDGDTEAVDIEFDWPQAYEQQNVPQ